MLRARPDRTPASTVKDTYGVDERSQKLKYYVQAAAGHCAQKMDFNDIRTRLNALISIYTNAYDQAVMPATEDSVRRALAIAVSY